MIYFPSYLPNPSVAYNAQSNPLLAVSQFETNFRQRQRFTETAERISVVWRFTQLEYDAFSYFVSNILKSGSLPFEVPIMGLDGIETREATIAGGLISPRYVNFGHWDVSADLIAKPATKMSEFVFEFLATPEGGEIDLFVETASILSLYIESFYGEYPASFEISKFMKLYA
jgi:hypothetical protein